MTSCSYALKSWNTLYIPHSIFNLARLLYVRPETSGPYYVWPNRAAASRSPCLRVVHFFCLFWVGTWNRNTACTCCAHGVLRFAGKIGDAWRPNADYSFPRSVLFYYSVCGMKFPCCGYNASIPTGYPFTSTTGYLASRNLPIRILYVSYYINKPTRCTFCMYLLYNFCTTLRVSSDHFVHHQEFMIYCICSSVQTMQSTVCTELQIQ